MSGVDHVIDINVIIGLLKGHTAAVELAHDGGLRLRRAAISQITRMELRGYPGLTEEEDRAARAFIGACHVIGLDDDVERHAVRMRRAGLLKLPDAIVAGSALAVGARLLTLDQRLAIAHAEQAG